MQADLPILYQVSPDAPASVSSLCHLFWQGNMCLSQKQWPDRLIAFRTNSLLLSTHQAKRQSWIPMLTNNAQRELLGNTSPIHTFSGAARNTAQAVFPTACLSKSPPSRAMKTVQVHRAQDKQIHSLIRTVKFYVLSLCMMIISMTWPYEQACNFKEKYMQPTALYLGRAQLSKENTKCTYFRSKCGVSRKNTGGVNTRLWPWRRSAMNFNV